MRRYIITEEQRAYVISEMEEQILSYEGRRRIAREFRSLPELPAVETGIYTFNAAANAVLDRILNRFDIPFEGDFFDSIDAIAEHISKIAPAEPETDGARACSNCRHESARATDWPCDECSANSGWEPITIKPVEAETCEWETVGLTSYNPHYGPLHDGDIRFESVSIVRGWRVCPYCAKPITIKPGD